MTDREMTSTLLLCGTVEVLAWGVAWFTNWSVVALGAALAISSGVAVAIVAMQRKRAKPRD
jgi:hypothetical protein